MVFYCQNYTLCEPLFYYHLQVLAFYESKNMKRKESVFSLYNFPGFLFRVTCVLIFFYIQELGFLFLLHNPSWDMDINNRIGFACAYIEEVSLIGKCLSPLTGVNALLLQKNKKCNPKITKDKSNSSHIINSRQIYEKDTVFSSFKKILSSNPGNTDAHPK